MPRRPRQIPIAALAACLALLPALADAQCALCRRALESGGQAGLMRGIYWSIVLILGMPFLIFGAFSYLLWKNAKRKAEIGAPAEAGPAPLALRDH